jgi:hypothetical protein
MDEEAVRLAYQKFLTKVAARYGRNSREYEAILAKANRQLLKMLDQISPKEKYVASLVCSEIGSLATNKLLGLKYQAPRKHRNRLSGAVAVPSRRATR